MVWFVLPRKYGLDDNTIDFIGHALALHRDDRYLNEPALDTVKRMKVGNYWFWRCQMCFEQWFSFIYLFFLSLFYSVTKFLSSTFIFEPLKVLFLSLLKHKCFISMCDLVLCSLLLTLYPDHLHGRKVHNSFRRARMLCFVLMLLLSS